MDPEDAFRKRARASGVVGGSSAAADGPDRLSSLPDCLLHSIMSFLKARQVVRTCVLSTRWRHLWRSVPRLDVDFDEFKKVPVSVSDNDSGSGGDHNSGPDDDASGSDDDEWNAGPDDGDEDDLLYDDDDVGFVNLREYKDWEDFEDFAVTLMRRCNMARLDSFRLRTDAFTATEFGNRVAAGWLRRALKYYAPAGGASRMGLSSGSWQLKRLHLCHVRLDGSFLNLVSSVCRSLEVLELDSCKCEIQSIASHSLKTLVLKRCRCRDLSEIISPTLKTLVIDGGWNSGDCVLVIMAPALAYLHLAMHIALFCGGVSLNEVPSVTKALVHLRCHGYDYPRSKLDGDQFKLLCSLSNSTNLELKGVGTTVLGEEPRFQEFKNLRNLLLDRCDLSDDFRTLVFFLRSSPILEKLTLRHCEFPEYSSNEDGTPILKKASSSELHGLDLLCENLKVEIIYKCDYGPQLINYGSHFISLLQLVSVNLSENNIKLTKVK